ncbi:MAG: FHA domain-containing protein [Janthinobacterium lividum]
MKNYYAILEVPVGCSLEEIRQAYHRLVQEHLDDEAVFSDLKEAYEVLTTPSRRAEYDRAAWGETFDSPSQFTGSSSLSLSLSGRCPMGAEAQCPVLQGRAEMSDKFCPECGYLLAALSSGAAFDLGVQSDPLKQVWLEDQNGQTQTLRIGSNIVGRESADILVPDKTVSRQHARLQMEKSGSLSVEDLSSTNGTQVNEVLLPAHVLRSLADGDRLRFGSVSLTLHLPSPDAAPLNISVPSSPLDSVLPNSDVLGQVTEIREEDARVFSLAQGITTFGRRVENTVVLTGDLYVSGNHAQIRADSEVFILTDIGSTNGTLLNGERLKINMPVSLDEGDMIVIGGSTFRFDRLSPAVGDNEPEEIAESAEPDIEPTEIPEEDAPEHVEG